MTESPPRPDLPHDEHGSFPLPPAPLPVAPWWASTTPDSDEPQAFLETADVPGIVVQEPVYATGPQPVVETADAPEIVVQEPVYMTGPQFVVETAGVLQEPAYVTGPQPVAPPPLPPAPSRSRKGLLVVCLVFLVAMTAATVAAVVIMMPTGQDVPLREVDAANTAAGLRKDPAMPEASASYPFIIAAARAGGVEDAITASGVYRDQATNAQDVLFLGGTAAIGNPNDFLQRARPSTALKVSKTLPGDPDGQISCGTFAVLKATHLYCAWATENTFGFIASNHPTETPQPTDLITLTNHMRTNLETHITD